MAELTRRTEEFRGTPLHETDISEGRVLSVRWDPNIKYAWDAGVGIGRYLMELKNGHLIGTRCATCRRVVVPPRVVCEGCFRPMADWVYLADTGTINTFSISYVDWDASRLQEPRVPAVIDLDGASKGCGILHLLGEVDPRAVRAGMRVKAVWKPQEERVGAITDIRHFRPI